MSNYVDSNELEKWWFFWTLASMTPDLDVYRSCGVLFTKVDVVPDTDKPDPYSANRKHLIAVGGKNCEFTSGDYAVQNAKLPMEMHPADQYEEYGVPQTPNNIVSDYIQEQPIIIAWKELISKISLICEGISKKLCQRTDLRSDLAHDALLVVMSKLQRGKLKYKPGKAPVFSLLTTTIHRCMFSILSKSTKQTQHTQKLVTDLASGNIKCPTRSLSLFSDGFNRQEIIRIH